MCALRRRSLLLFLRPSENPKLGKSAPSARKSDPCSSAVAVKANSTLLKHYQHQHRLCFHPSAEPRNLANETRGANIRTAITTCSCCFLFDYPHMLVN